MHQVLSVSFRQWIMLIVTATLALTVPEVGITQVRPTPFNPTQRVSLSLRAPSFSVVIAALSNQLHCTIVADDAPLTKVEKFELELTAKEALDQIADAYDYTWEIGKRGVILMRKRFHKPEEHPQINLPEIRETIRNINTVFNFQNVTADLFQQISLLNALVSSLSPEQRATLTSGHILQMNAFNLPQQQIIQQAIANSVLSDAQLAWHQLDAQFIFLPNSRLGLQGSAIHTDLVTGVRTEQPTLAYIWKGAEGLEHSSALLHGATVFDLHPEK